MANELELCPTCSRAGEDLLEQASSWAAFERAHDDLIASCARDHQRAESGDA